MTKNTDDDRYGDAILVALWDGLGRNLAMRDGVLAEMDPADRENIWHEVAEARGRITKGARPGSR